MPKRPGGKKSSGLDDATLSSLPVFSPSGQGFADLRNKLPPWKQQLPRCRSKLMAQNRPVDDLFYSTGVQQSSHLNGNLSTCDFFATKVAYTQRWRSEPYPIFSDAPKWQKKRSIMTLTPLNERLDINSYTRESPFAPFTDPYLNMEHFFRPQPSGQTPCAANLPALSRIP